jgi:hypothetical protein
MSTQAFSSLPPNPTTQRALVTTRITEKTAALLLYSVAIAARAWRG